ncbi:MAG TPA: F390 synthetase-related protein, partial [Chitinophagaceae bacterium]|nr:F390 synthetase-related protein [Chitinophagaceae bacterium]
MRFKLTILWYLLQFRVSRLLLRNRIPLLQAVRMRSWRKVLARSPFYRPYAQAPLDTIPPSNKRLFMQEFDRINTCGISLDEALHLALQAEQTRDFTPTINGITVGLSTGTSGNRGVFLASEGERARWVAAVLDRVLPLRWKPQRVAFFLRANSNLYGSVQSSLLRFHFFDLLHSVDENLERLQAVQPEILVAQPSMLLRIARALECGQIRIQPVKVISVAEVLTPEDQAYLGRVFGQLIHQVYQCTEGFLASTCREGTLHFHEDFLLIEKKYVDVERRRFHPVITDLLRRTQPVVRYELNDIIVARESCPCGSPHLAIERIEGRSDDVLRFRSKSEEPVAIFPDFFRKAIVLADAA